MPVLVDCPPDLVVGVDAGPKLRLDLYAGLRGETRYDLGLRLPFPAGDALEVTPESIEKMNQFILH